ncbi:hypothetical protein BZG36_00896 [Bifiguratus adelaidae]|uniref:HTH APSES-type domain-containing protein n=1 Tax=Bifiguratus adelaidae TaxID=1938954 RepID=A0A261Y5Q1_9FUNG|nr:hypothetical protein BZG36_00896 [Bifiguratus adelaidae]
MNGVFQQQPPLGDEGSPYQRTYRSHHPSHHTQRAHHYYSPYSPHYAPFQWHTQQHLPESQQWQQLSHYTTSPNPAPGGLVATSDYFHVYGQQPHPHSGLESTSQSAHSGAINPIMTPGPTDQPLQTYAPINPPQITPKLTTTVWDDENTMCYQVEVNGICVARRNDNQMVNGTKLLNVVGMSRGKRDGILKNEKGRVVVKVGAMHLKGVWIPLVRARDLSQHFKISELLHPLLSDDLDYYIYNPQYPATNAQYPPTKVPKALPAPESSQGSFSTC